MIPVNVTCFSCFSGLANPNINSKEGGAEALRDPPTPPRSSPLTFGISRPHVLPSSSLHLLSQQSRAEEKKVSRVERGWVLVLLCSCCFVCVCVCVCVCHEYPLRVCALGRCGSPHL